MNIQHLVAMVASIHDPAHGAGISIILGLCGSQLLNLEPSWSLLSIGVFTEVKYQMIELNS